MIDPTDTEDVLTLVQATKVLPPGRNNARVCLSTLVRWLRDGVVGPNGNRVYLGPTHWGYPFG